MRAISDSANSSEMKSIASRKEKRKVPQFGWGRWVQELSISLIINKYNFIYDCRQTDSIKSSLKITDRFYIYAAICDFINYQFRSNKLFCICI